LRRGHGLGAASAALSPAACHKQQRRQQQYTV
jgi:hypothetical protein